MEQQSRFSERVENLIKEEQVWRKSWSHPNPCERWKKEIEIFGEGYCKHYVKARTEHFKEEIRSILDMNTWDDKVYLWVYILNK